MNNFSNRELALIIWSLAILLFLLIYNKTRNIVFEFPKILLQHRIFFVLFFSFFTCAIINIELLHRFSLWDTSMLKDSIIWFLGFGIVTLYKINEVRSVHFFKEMVRSSFKWTVIFEFIVNFYSLGLIVELILIPFVTLLVLGKQMKLYKEEEINKTFDIILNLLGAGMVLFSSIKMLFNYQTFYTLSTFKMFILPIQLTILIIPFYYLLAVYIIYGTVFAKIECLFKRSDYKKKLKKTIFLTAKFNIDKIDRIKSNFNKYDLIHSDKSKRYFKIISIQDR